MNVVGHQDVSVELAASLPEGFVQPVEVGVVIVFVQEAGVAVVPALHDVQGQTIKMGTATTWHTKNVSRAGEEGVNGREIEPGLFSAFSAFSDPNLVSFSPDRHLASERVSYPLQAGNLWVAARPRTSMQSNSMIARVVLSRETGKKPDGRNPASSNTDSDSMKPGVPS